MTEIEDVIKGIKDCESKNECYNKSAKCLYFEPREARMVFISESPYNYPSPQSDPPIVTPEDFKNKTLNKALNDEKEKEKKRKSEHSADVPHNIFAFIYDTFKPIFKNNNNNLADNFLGKVYWTHVGKRRPLNKKKELFQCAKLHLKKEIEALKPKLVVIASQLACKFFWNHQTSEDQRVKWTKVKEFLANQMESLQQSNRLLQLPGYSFETAIFPNPSPKNACKKRYYEQYKLESVKKRVWELVEQEYGT